MTIQRVGLVSYVHHLTSVPALDPGEYFPAEAATAAAIVLYRRRASRTPKPSHANVPVGTAMTESDSAVSAESFAMTSAPVFIPSDDPVFIPSGERPRNGRNRG